MVGKTYVTGNSGLFQVYDHVTNTWTDYTGFTTVDLMDVKTDDNDPNYAIICGLNYIGYTTNAGATVTQITFFPGNSISRAYQISIPESVTSAIYICGTNGSGPRLVKSVDGGVTYTDASGTTFYTSDSNTALTVHFKDDLIGVVAAGIYTWKTVDGGVTWTQLNSNSSIPLTEVISGIHISANEQVIVAVTNKSVYRSTDGGLNFVLFFPYSPPYDASVLLKYTHLTWYDDNNMWISGNNAPIFYSADAGITWTEVLPDQPQDDGRYIWGSHFYTLTEGFLSISDGGEGTAATYKADNATTSITTTQSFAYVPYNIGTSVWTLLKTDIYALYDCTEEADPIYSNSPELNAVVGKVIKIEGSTACWEVFLIQYDDETLVDVVIATNNYDIPQIFKDCECCLPPVPPEPVKYTRVIPKPDKKFYQITQSQCDITANIRFADAYYRLFKNLRYGINSQCDTVSLEKTWIKKQLSDLAVINDPTACVITTPVVPVICPEPS